MQNLAAHLLVTDGIYHSLGSCHLRQVAAKHKIMALSGHRGNCWSRGVLVMNSFGSGKDQLPSSEWLGMGKDIKHNQLY